MIPVLPRVDTGESDEPYRLACLGDIHLGSEYCDERAFEADLARIVEDERLGVILLGDLFDAANRYQKHGSVYHTTRNLNDALNYACEQLAAIKDRIVGITKGNHDDYVDRAVGLDPVEQCAARLGLADRYRPDGFFLQLAVGKAAHSHDRFGGPRPLIYTAYVYHGDKNGKSRSSLERAGSVVVADAYVSGHTHDPQVFTDVLYQFHPQTQSLVERRRTYMTAGSYLDYGGYAQRATLRPHERGYTVLEFDPRERRVTGHI